LIFFGGDLQQVVYKKIVLVLGIVIKYEAQYT